MINISINLNFLLIFDNFKKNYSHIFSFFPFLSHRFENIKDSTFFDHYSRDNIYSYLLSGERKELSSCLPFLFLLPFRFGGIFK